MKSPRTLPKNLRSPAPLDANALARVAGGESASTSMSATPTVESYQKLLSYVYAGGNS